MSEPSHTVPDEVPQNVRDEFDAALDAHIREWKHAVLQVLQEKKTDGRS